MKKPEIFPHATDPNLSSGNEDSSWIIGRNCVYRGSSPNSFRVSIRAGDGWKSYGTFTDFETATYVANVAILAENCEGRYALNEGIGEKDRMELKRWRSNPKNARAEEYAKNKYKRIQAELSALREEEERKAGLERRQTAELKDAQRRLQEAERKRREASLEAERRKLKEEKTRILCLSNSELVKFIKSTDRSDPFYWLATQEASRRYKALGISGKS